MKEVSKKPINDKYVFKCYNLYCEKKDSTLSIRTNSFLKDCKLTLQKCLHMLWKFYKKEPINQLGVFFTCSLIRAYSLLDPSLLLVSYLDSHDIGVCSTLRANKKHVPCFSKKMKIGEIEKKSCENLLVLCWYDK